MANLSPSTPSPQDHIGRSSFRDDATIQAVADRLAGDVAEIVVLDCGCQNGRLANAMIAAQLDLTRICYFGVEMDIRHVNAVKAAKRRGAFKDYKHFDIRLREITDMDGYELGSFDFVIVNNLLHEIPAEDIARSFQTLNELLVPLDGRLVIIDMEELPPEEREPHAVTYSAEEVRRMLIAGGFNPYVSSHQKLVKVLRAVTGPTPNGVDTERIAAALREILNEKKIRVMEVAADHRSRGNGSEDALRCLFKLAAIELSIHQLEAEVSNELFSERDASDRRTALALADLGKRRR